MTGVQTCALPIYVKSAKGDGHKIIITLSNLFTTPLATGVPFSWKDLTPV